MHVAVVVAALISLPAQSSLDDPMGGGTQPGALTTGLAHNETCKNCHESTTGDTRMASTSYRATMMDLAGYDPIFLAALEVASYDAPASTELCIRCHFPRAWLAGRTNGAPADEFGLLEDDKQGVQCDYCHRMLVPAPTSPDSVVPPPELSGVLLSNNQAFLSNNTRKQGPFATTNTIGHSSDTSPLFTDSVLCGQCHDVSNTFKERIDLDGSALGVPVPIERTYSEWRDSAYSVPGSPDHKSCMDCHMERYVGKAADTQSSPERELRSHKLVGANTVAPLMVAHLYQGAAAPEFLQDIAADAQATVEAAKRQIEGAATLEATALVGGALRVRVTNLTGHKLPTGYAEGRRMYLGHAVRFPDGTAGLESGVIDPSTWDFVPGKEPARSYEVLVSEGLSPESSFHFVKVDRLIKDNRIPPKGFRPAVDTPVLGGEYPLQADGSLAHWDEVDVPLGDVECWPALVTVRLSFQASSGEYLRFLIENAPIYGPDLEDALAATGSPPHVMEELTVAVHEDGRIEPPGVFSCTPPAVVDAGAAPPRDGGLVVTPRADAGQGDEDNDDDDAGGCGCGSSEPGSFALLALLAGLLTTTRHRSRRRLAVTPRNA